VAVTVEQLRSEFPEYAHTDSGLLAGKIADATAMLNPSAFGALYDQAVKYMACHLVALSPSGEFARLDPKDQDDGARTTYERQYQRILRGLATPMVV